MPEGWALSARGAGTKRQRGRALSARGVGTMGLKGGATKMCRVTIYM